MSFSFSKKFKEVSNFYTESNLLILVKDNLVNISQLWLEMGFESLIQIVAGCKWVVGIEPNYSKASESDIKSHY